MLAKRIIPCLDVDDGRVKKGVNFVNLVDVGSPVDIAASYEQQQADEQRQMCIRDSIYATHRGWRYQEC